MAAEEQISLFSLGESADPALASAAVPAIDVAQIPHNSAVPIPPGTYGSIEEMAAHCRLCQRCGLAAGRTHAVIGRGNPQAMIAIVGEGPGQTEDETGLPFVGKSGQLLDKILASVRLSTEQDVYICNVVRCRPPQNRAPTAIEIEACRPYLLEQLRLIDPKIILLTGATALRGVTGLKTGITKLRGQWLEWEGRLCMPVFHPAYLLRNPSRDQGSPKWLMWQDIQAVRAKLDELLDAEF